MSLHVHVGLSELVLGVGKGYHYDDVATQARLEASVKAFGQLRPLLVRTRADGSYEVLDGRKLVLAMVAAGLERADAIDLGLLSDTDAGRLAMALLVGFEVDYARVALLASGLCDAGMAEADLAACSPFTAERIGYFRKLARFDWREFDQQPDDQHALDWEAGFSEAPLAPPPDAPPSDLLSFLSPVFDVPVSAGEQETLF